MKSLGLALLGGPLWVDAQVQRAVDAGMHALMRAGASKAMIRYVLHVAFTLTLVGSAYFWVRAAAGPLGFWDLVWYPVVLLVVVAGGELQRRSDEKEEATGVVPRQRSRFWRLWWISWMPSDVGKLCGLLSMETHFSARPDLARPHAIAGVMITAIGLLIEYTQSTPPRPPARKAKQVLVPVRAAS